MKTLLLVILILATGLIVNGQVPKSNSQPSLKVHDALWIAHGGDVYNGGWGDEGTSNYPFVPAELRNPNKKRSPVDAHPRVLLQNTGAKMIKAFDLDFIFLDPQSTVEFLRYRFHAKTNMKAGKAREFSQDVFQKVGPNRRKYSPSAPSIDVLLKTRDAVQKVRVQRIEYADGTVWERP